MNIEKVKSKFEYKYIDINEYTKPAHTWTMPIEKLGIVFTVENSKTRQAIWIDIQDDSIIYCQVWTEDMSNDDCILWVWNKIKGYMLDVMLETFGG